MKSGELKSSLFLKANYTQALPGHGLRERTDNCNIPVHDDLLNAFKRLKPHLAILCDELDPKKKQLQQWSVDSLEKYTVSKIVIKGDDEITGVEINGHKENKYGIVNLDTPLTKFDSTEYAYPIELKEDVEALITEMELYLFEGKRAPEKQMGFDFPDEPTPTEV